MSTKDFSQHYDKIRMHKDMILAVELKGEEKIGNIIVPETSQFANPFYRVVSIGPDVKLTAVGDYVFPEKGSMMRMGRSQYALIHEDTQLACTLTPESFIALFGEVEARVV